MRIAQVAPLSESVPPRLYGGTERVVAYLVDELVAAGHEVTLFASGDSHGPARLVPLCERALRGAHPVDPLALHVRAVGEVYRRSSEFDVIHFHLEYVHFPASAWHPAPHVTTLHGRLDIPELASLYRTYCEEPLISISDAQRGPITHANWQAT